MELFELCKYMSLSIEFLEFSIEVLSTFIPNEL